MKGDKNKKEIDLIWRIINKKYSYVFLPKILYKYFNCANNLKKIR